MSLRSHHAELSIHSSMEVDREEYLDYMTFRSNKRPLFTEIFGPLTGLREEWKAQGATPAELDFSAYRYRRPSHGFVPVNTGWMGGESEVLLEETDAHILARDRMGRTVRLCRGYASIPLPLDYPVRSMDDWLRIKPRYLFSEERWGGDWKRAAEEHRSAGRVVTVSIPGGFSEPRELMGDERLCMAYHDDPEMVHDMLATFTDTSVQVLDRVSEAVRIDELFVHEDMAGRNGPLAGPRQVEEFIVPYYRQVWELLRNRGARLFRQDSDGDIRPILPLFVEAGLNVTYPAEPAAGMDILQLRREYGRRLAFEGGIDKHVLRRGTEEIDAELERKIPPMVRTGGCVLGLDHRIPPGTPLANYRHYIRKAWEIMERESGDGIVTNGVRNRT